MKLEQRPHKRRTKAVEMLTQPEEPRSEFLFDPEKEILPEIWVQFTQYVDSADPVKAFPDRESVLLLSILDPARLELVRKHPKIEASLIEQFVQEYTQADSPGASADLFRRVAQFIQIFPDLQVRIEKKLKKNLANFFPEVWRWTLNTNFMPLNSLNARGVVQVCRSMDQLCPDKISELRQRTNQKKIWEDGLQRLKEMCVDDFSMEDIPVLASELLLYYPEKKEEILRVIRPHWQIIKEKVHELGTAVVEGDRFHKQFAEAVFGLALISAKEIRWVDHRVELIPQEKRVLDVKQPLPTRSEL